MLLVHGIDDKDGKDTVVKEVQPLKVYEKTLAGFVLFIPKDVSSGNETVVSAVHPSKAWSKVFESAACKSGALNDVNEVHEVKAYLKE